MVIAGYPACLARHATRNLRRRRQELLRHAPLLEEIGQ
jgi:hypothetical protein